MCKISILMPIYNTEKYLSQALDSVINQTMDDIEVICVNDGSTDSTKDILKKYASKDNRIKVFHKNNTGYGNTMNIAIDNSIGEFLTIVEPDDFIELDMCENLYITAQEHKLDVIKANYYHHYDDGSEDRLIDLYNNFTYDDVFCPQNNIMFFTSPTSTVSALYKRSFIKENNIRYTETPGAAYQDTAFNFKVSFYSKRMMLVHNGYYHYRLDNPNSSRNQTNKAFCIVDEHHEIETFINRNCHVDKEIIKALKFIKFGSYYWNYEKSTPDVKQVFYQYFKAEFKKDNFLGLLDKKYFTEQRWSLLQQLLNSDDDLYNNNLNLKNNNHILQQNNELNEKNTELNKKIMSLSKINDIFIEEKKILKKAIKILSN